MNDGFLSLYSIINDSQTSSTATSFNFSLLQHVLWWKINWKTNCGLIASDVWGTDETSLSYSCTYLYHKSCKNPILRTRVKIEQYLPRQQRHLTIISSSHWNSWGSREDAQNNVCADLVLFKKCVRLIIYAQHAIGTFQTVLLTFTSIIFIYFIEWVTFTTRDFVPFCFSSVFTRNF